MPRARRKSSESGIYHVMLRGINRQQIFLDAEDYDMFLQVLRDCQGKSRFLCYAYCLMGNHIHLLIQITHEPLEMIFRRIGSRYVYWYNWKYGRSGHLFQDRYKSEVIEEDAALLSVVRYIHNNPVKAGLVTQAEDYEWSSSKVYHEPRDSLISVLPVLQLFSDHPEAQLPLYQEYMNQEDSIPHLEDCGVRLNDNQAQEVMRQICSAASPTEFHALPEQIRIDSIPLIRKQGVSLRQMARLTGLTVGILRKYT